MTRLLTVALLAAACSSRAPTPTHPDGTGSGSASGGGSAVTGGGSGSGSAVATAATVTRADCLAVFDHIIELDLKERPPDHQLTKEQIAAQRSELEQQMMDQCLKQPPDQIACYRAATSTAAVRACDK